MMVVALRPTGRQLSERQVESMGALLSAAETEVEEVGYDRLSVRSVAKRAGVAPATAYTYVSSKDHLLAEILWARVLGAPIPEVDLEVDVAGRIAGAVDALSALSVGSPALIAACTQALLSSNVDVAKLREAIGTEVYRRLQVAAAGECDDEAVAVIATTYFGSLLSAGMGHMAYDEVAGFAARATRLLVAGARAGGAT